jgi:hypothetical protein
MPKYYIKACQFCNRPCKGPKGKAVHERHCRSLIDKAAKVAEAIEHPSNGIDLQRLNHMCDNAWSRLSLGDKVMALSSITFDPSNPTGE